MAGLLYAFADESGQRGYSPRSSECFVLAAVGYREEDEDRAHQLLTDLRLQTRRQPHQPLKWQTLSHEQRVYVSQRLGAAPFLLGSAVVVYKGGIPDAARLLDEDKAYLFTYRFLLERLSWMARALGRDLRWTLAHVIRFKSAKLAEYHARLRSIQTTICWDHCNTLTKIDQPNRIQCLQLGDLLAGAAARAFEPDVYGNVERRYLSEILPVLRRGRTGRLISYGLKVHPWSDATRARFPWLEELDVTEHEIPA